MIKRKLPLAEKFSGPLRVRLRQVLLYLAASSVWEHKESDNHLSKRFSSILPDALTLKMVTTALIDVLENLYSSMGLNPESWYKVIVAVMFVCLYCGLPRFFFNKIIRIKMLPHLPSFLERFRVWTCPWRTHVTILILHTLPSSSVSLQAVVARLCIAQCTLSDWCAQKETKTQPLSSDVCLVRSYFRSTGLFNCHKVFRPLHMLAFNIIKSICWQQVRASHGSFLIERDCRLN